jgi:hypothetical protein
MRTVGILAVVLCISVYLIPAGAQEGKVIVEYPASKELKRTSHQLHIPVGQLKNAREALRDATALAKKVGPNASVQSSMLAESWILLYRSKAAESIESIFDSYRLAAKKAADLQFYRQCTAAAQSLLSPLFEVNPDKANTLLKEWPVPDLSLGDEARQFRDQIISQQQQQLMHRMGYRDPEKALELLQAKSPVALSYALRGRLAQHMVNTGRRDKAFDLVDQTLSDFKRNPDRVPLDDYANFVQQLPMVSPGHFLEAFDLLAKAAMNSSPGSNTPSATNVGSETLMLEPGEATVLSVFRSLLGRPELLVKALSTLPALKMKIDRVGGIDYYLNPNTAPTQMSPEAVTAPTQAVSSDGQLSASELYQLLRGKAEKDPSMVRAKLSASVKGAEQVEILLQVAQRAALDDPELSSVALEIASPLVLQVSPLPRRATLLQQLIRLYRQCDGEVSPKILRDGFVVADQVREEEKENHPQRAQRTGLNSMADQLELVILAELALDDFPTAIRFVRSMPDDAVKYGALMQIIQSLRYNF